MKKLTSKNRESRIENWFVLLCQTCLGVFLLVFTSFMLLLLVMGLPHLDWHFIAGYHSRFPDQAGVLSAVAGTCELILLVVIFACPLGILSAIFLHEYGEESSYRPLRITSRLVDALLCGMDAVPSVVYGFLGLALFINGMSLGRSLLAAALTLSAMAVPSIISSCRNALDSVPRETRELSFALGATRWQTLQSHVLPQALPDIISGTCLVLIRVSGEAAPLLVVGALSYMTFIPDSLFSPFAALPVEIYNWTLQAGSGTHSNGAAAILLLLPFLLFFNTLAVIWRRHLGKRSDGSAVK